MSVELADAAPSGDLRGFVLVVGPDGAGKSTVVEGLLGAAARRGGRTTHAHCRPGAILRSRSSGAPVVNPHGTPPRRLALAASKLAVVFVPVRQLLFGLISNIAIFTSLIRSLLVKPLDIEIGKDSPLFPGHINTMTIFVNGFYGVMIARIEAWIQLDRK